MRCSECDKESDYLRENARRAKRKLELLGGADAHA